MDISTETYDLIVIGAGSGGLTAAGFAAQLGDKVALVEKHRIGGDCTWTGCVPSKALIKAAKVAHEVRTASHFGITTSAPQIDMARVRDYVRAAIATVYESESPAKLRQSGVEVFLAEAKFLDAHTVQAGSDRLQGRNILICTGARPVIPPIPGLADVPFLTYEDIFDLDRLPERLVVIGAGPIGLEIAQAFQRLGSQVTVIGERLLPRDDREAADVLERVLAREGIMFVHAKAKAVRRDGSRIAVRAEDSEVICDTLLVATGRQPNVDGLDLERAGVAHSARGIRVDAKLRTSVKHIYAAGEVAGGYQFTHFAGWQAFQAARNALLLGSSAGFTDVVPWSTFTDPEVAHVGLTEAAARQKFGGEVMVIRRSLGEIDRAVCEHDTDGFFKIMATRGGTLLGATIVAARAGEAITELIVAMKQGLKLADLAAAIHPYPTYSTAVQQMAARAAVEMLLTSATGRILVGLSKLIR